MPGALIAIDQDRPGDTTSFGTPGVARIDLWVNRTIRPRSATSGNASQEWTLLNAPAGSSAVIASPLDETCSFDPDLPGTYRLQLVTNGGGAGNIQILICGVRFDNAGVQVNRGWRVPGVGETSAEGNYAGNTRGWSEPIEFIIADLLGMGGGAVVFTDPATPTTSPMHGARGSVQLPSDPTKLGTVNLASTSGGGAVGATEDYATIGGGRDHRASGQYATVAGGGVNEAQYDYSTVGGGQDNHAEFSHATVAGGWQNVAGGTASTVGGGRECQAVGGDYTTCGGGYQNTANGQYGTVGGGTGNVTNATGACVPGGRNNLATGQDSFAFGNGATCASQDSVALGGAAHVGTSANGSLAIGNGLIATSLGSGSRVDNSATGSVALSGFVFEGAARAIAILGQAIAPRAVALAPDAYAWQRGYSVFGHGAFVPGSSAAIPEVISGQAGNIVVVGESASATTFELFVANSTIATGGTRIQVLNSIDSIRGAIFVTTFLLEVRVLVTRNNRAGAVPLGVQALCVHRTGTTTIISTSPITMPAGEAGTGGISLALGVDGATGDLKVNVTTDVANVRAVGSVRVLECWEGANP